MSRASLMAGFEVTLHGRIWVTPEAQAEGKFRTENGQTTLELQNLYIEEQNVVKELQDQMAHGGTGGDYSLVIVQDVAVGQQALAELNSDFDSASRLVDALPWWAFGLRRSRELTRESVNKTNEQVKKMLETKPNHGLYRISWSSCPRNRPDSSPI
jgi:hypothetical protein